MIYVEDIFYMAWMEASGEKVGMQNCSEAGATSREGKAISDMK